MALMTVFCMIYQWRWPKDTITKISRLGKIPTVDPLVGIFDPKMVFFRLRKSQKKVRKNIDVSNLEVAPAQITCDNLQTK